MNSIKLRSLRVVNYLGAGDEGVTVEFDPRCTAICGPNNSGKTTILSAIEHVTSFARFSSPLPDSTATHVLYKAEAAIDDLFHFDAPKRECRFEVVLALTTDFAPTFKPRCDEAVLELGFDLTMRSGSKELMSLIVGDEAVFDSERETHRFRMKDDEHLHPQTGSTEAAGLLDRVTGHVMSFGSLRGINERGANDVHSMGRYIEGILIANWVRDAMLPDPRDPLSKKRNALLKEFQAEFADFAKLIGFELSAPSSGNELNVRIRGNVLPLSRIGTGIGECLLMMLVCKLAKELQPFIGNDPPIDIIIIEEPELHLHPMLQRRFVEYLLDYCSKNDTQLIVSTHSPTVLNVVQRRGGAIVRTEWDESSQQIAAHPVSTTGHLLRLFKEIGVSPGDLLQADKVLWVEGPYDIPVFREWLSKAPSFRNQAIAVVSLGGDASASPAFDFKAVKEINPNCMVILDSERSVAGGAPKGKRLEAKSKCDAAGIECHLTDYRSTESYFSPSALAAVYSRVPTSLDPFTELSKQVFGFSKSDCGKVAAAMTWPDIEATDVGKRIEEFLSR
jgi:hypothetical protein